MDQAHLRSLCPLTSETLCFPLKILIKKQGTGHGTGCKLAPILSPRKRMSELRTQKSCARLHVICILFTCDHFHVQMHNPPTPVLLPQGPLSHCPHHPPRPCPSSPDPCHNPPHPLPPSCQGPQSGPSLPARTHLPHIQNRLLESYSSVQEGHPCLPPPALSRAGTADSKRGSQQIPAPFSLVINGAALPMNLPLILRKL